MTKLRKTIAAAAITIATIGGGAASSSEVHAGAQTFTRNCHRQTGDHQFDRQLCRQRFQRDLNNFGLTVHHCSSSTTFMWLSYYNSASCYVTW